jgi:shikimate kinase|tara:strand:+ start:5149 stop:5643 length:495 start_codon:yes stop_codon:yes gene_type:complete
MMGVGKSTIAKTLAKKLSFNFVDIDELIEKKESCSINDIFRNKSEIFFRKLENKITLEELQKKGSVISLGGGAFLNRSIRQSVKRSSISFWIDVSLDILIKRLKKTKKRPLLVNKDLNKEVSKIYLERKKNYNQADFKIKCDFLKKDEIVKEILKLYENTRNQI